MTRRTSPLTLLLLALACGGVAWAVESWLVATGRAILVAPMTLPITLSLTAIALIVLAWPIRRYTRALASFQHRAELPEDEAEEARDIELARAAVNRRVPPQRAVMVLAFAKASSLTGALIGGCSAGTLLFLLTRTVVTGASVPEAGCAAVASALLLTAGLVAESWCALPPASPGMTRERPTPAA